MGFTAAYSMCRQTFHQKRSRFPTPFIGIEVKRAKVELRLGAYRQELWFEWHLGVMTTPGGDPSRGC
jgi:hypothetical protein